MISLRFASLATGDLKSSARRACAQPGTPILSVAIGHNAMTQQRGSVRRHAVDAGQAIRGGMARKHSGGMRPGELNQCKHYPNAMPQGCGTVSFVEKKADLPQAQNKVCFVIFPVRKAGWSHYLTSCRFGFSIQLWLRKTIQSNRKTCGKECTSGCLGMRYR